jgi:hypothetical protein
VGFDKMNNQLDRSFNYGFIISTLTYLLLSVPLLVLFATVFRGLSEPLVDFRGMLSFLTLGLSDFQAWTIFHFLVVLIPWIVSCGVLVLLTYRFDGGPGRRVLFSGFSISIYYLAVCLAFAISRRVLGPGDVAYGLIWFWPVVGFIAGCVVSGMVEIIGKQTGWFRRQ